MKEPDKRIVFAVRLILIAWGLIIGWTFAQFIFRLYPDYLSAGYELIIQMVNAVVFAVILSTLARPVSAFALFIGRLLRKTFLEKPLYVTVGAVLGAVIGVMTGVLANAIVEVFTSLFAARFIVAFSAAVLGAYTGYLGCRRWLSSTFTDDENVVIEYSGYILTYSAFFSDKVVYVAQLINGKIYILGKTLRRLIELADTDAAAKKALENYLKLSEYSAVKIVNTDTGKEENEDIVALAESKLLKIIAGETDEIKETDSVKVLSLAEL